MWLVCPAHVLRLIARWERVHLGPRWGSPSVLFAEVHLLGISSHPFPAGVEVLLSSAFCLSKSLFKTPNILT